MRTSDFLFPLALAASLTAQRTPELEPNNSVAQAQLLTPGLHVTANLAAGEQDWFLFTLAAPGQVHLRTSGNFAVNPSVDTQVAIYDATGTTRLAWNDSADGVHSDCGVTLAAGTYTGLVMGKLATTAGDYGMDFAVLPVVAINTVEGAEPNNAPSLGGTPTVITLGDTFSGELTTTGDVDWFQFTLTTRTVVQVAVMDDGDVPQLDQTRLQYYQETAPGNWATLGSASQNIAMHRNFTLTHTNTLLPGNYAIEVGSNTTATGTAPWQYNKTGKYAVRTRAVLMPALSTATETPEPNNTTLTAGALTLGDDATGSISGSNEGDWFMFAVSGPTTLAAQCETGPAPGCTGTTIRVYDADGVVLATGSGGATTHGRLITTLRAAGIYYVEVAGAVFASAGNYVLHTGGVDPLFVAIGQTTQPPSVNACPGSNGLRPNLGNASGERPFLGTTYVMRISNAVANTIIVPMIGLSDRLAAGGTIPLPFDLTPLGAPGCFIRVDPLVTLGFLADGSGTAFIDFPLLPTISARGTAVFIQCLCFDPFLAGNTLQLTVSNDQRIIAGDRSF